MFLAQKKVRMSFVAAAVVVVVIVATSFYFLLCNEDSFREHFTVFVSGKGQSFARTP